MQKRHLRITILFGGAKVIKRKRTKVIFFKEKKEGYFKRFMGGFKVKIIAE